MRTAVLFGAMTGDWARAISQRVGAAYQVVAVTGRELEPRLAASAQVLISSRFDVHMPPMEHLELLQIPLAGIDLVDLSAVPAAASVCNVDGHEAAVGEYVILAMLAWNRRLLESVESFRRADWTMSSRANGPLLDELTGQTVGIIGYGGIGRAVAARAAALGMRVLACNRSAVSADAHLHGILPWSDLPALLRDSDFLVVACAAAAETIGLIDRSTLALMKRSAVVINVARGECVDEEALYNACRTGTIGGALLDVWYCYPPAGRSAAVRPSKYPFHELGNVVMTPHNSAWTRGTVERRIAQIADNLGRLARGQALTRVVRTAAPRASAARRAQPSLEESRTC